MDKTTKTTKPAYAAPQAEIVLFETEQLIAASNKLNDMSGNSIYDEGF